jgi:predicted aminopeptidase
MSITVREVYDRVLSTLSPTDRLRLATLILNDLVQQNLSIVDESETWNEEDKIDVTTFSLQYAAALFPENEEM